MSGTTGIPRASKTSSASGQVGPLAASTISLALDLAGEAGVEDAAEGGGDQDVDGQGQQLLVGDRLGRGEADDLAGDRDVLVEVGDGEARGVGIPPKASETATTLPPRWWRKRAAKLPTLP